MDERLRSFLNAGETILWRGKSAAFPLLDRHAGNRQKIVGRWAAVAVLAAAMLAVYLLNNQPASPAIVMLIAAVAGLLIFSPLVEWRSVMGARYWITDQHVIIMQRNKAIFSMRLEQVDAIEIVRDEAPNPCLVLGSGALDDIGRQLRWRCCHPADRPSSSEDNNALGLVFYNVKDLDHVVSLLKQRLAAAGMCPRRGAIARAANGSLRGQEA